jgi:hypothetical protein
MSPRRRQFRAKAGKARRVPGAMNGLERAYSQHLDARIATGEILSWSFECVTLKLADACRYTPDFMVIASDCTVEFHETKGRWMDDAKVKFKVAAAQFPFRFVAVYRDKLRDGGRFRFEDADRFAEEQAA